MLQRHPVQKLHDDERLAVLLADVINRADVGMVQGGSCLGLAPETLQSVAVLGYIFGQELQAYKTVESAVLGLVHHTHPAAAQFLDDAVVRDGLSDHFEGNSSLRRRRS